tara:strand:+ start:622 stop:1020 length:399 start_codon:yes stop_codon:yes gene_type:complete
MTNGIITDKETIQKSDNICGTYLQGYLKIKYSTLVKLFGNPHYKYEKGSDSCNKTDVEWCFSFHDGAPFTIYNWKNGKAYLGRDGLKVENIQDWNIGGKNKNSYHRLIDYIEQESRKNSILITPPSYEVHQY